MAAGVSLVETLPPVQRLALSYAPKRGRHSLLGLLALDARLAAIVRSAREPMLAQLRLAWWREQLSAERANWPGGDPLLAQLGHWPGNVAVLAALAGGWEALTGAAPLPATAFEALAEARAAAFAELATGAVERAAAERMARNWALADIAGRLSHPAERDAAVALARAQDWRREPLSRSLRPLAVLHGIAKGAIASGCQGEAISMSSFATAVRIGLFGR